jgi:hypothetical protein
MSITLLSLCIAAALAQPPAGAVDEPTIAEAIRQAQPDKSQPANSAEEHRSTQPAPPARPAPVEQVGVDEPVMPSPAEPPAKPRSASPATLPTDQHASPPAETNATAPAAPAAIPPLQWTPTNQSDTPARPAQPAQPVITPQDARFNAALRAVLAERPDSEVVILLDRSASMIGHWAWVQQNLGEILAAIPTDRPARLIVFAEGALTREIPTDDKNLAALVAAELRPAGNSALTAAIRMTRAKLAETPTTILLLSDGLATTPGAVSAAGALPTSARLHTMYFGSQVPAGVDRMRRLAHTGRGTFTNVTKR